LLQDPRPNPALQYLRELVHEPLIKSLPWHNVDLAFKPDTEFLLHRLPYPECEIKYLPATGAAIIYKNQSLFFIAPGMA